MSQSNGTSGQNHLSSEKLAELKQLIQAALPDDVDHVEYEPTGAEALLWEMHPRLVWTRETARKHGTVPIGLLMCNLVRMASVIAPEFRIGDLGKGPITYDIAVCLYGSSGFGKSTCWDISKSTLTIEPDILQVPQLTPEGLRNYVSFSDANNTTIRKAYSALVFMDEGETLDKLGQRSGNTLMPTVRSLVHGRSSALGGMTASNGVIAIEDRSLRFTMAFGTQSSHVREVFGDKAVDDGTTQRFYCVDMSKGYSTHDDMVAPQILTIADVLPFNMLPTGMNSAGVIIVPGNVASSAMVRPKVMHSVVPPSHLAFMRQHERLRKSNKILANKSHHGVNIIKLAHLLSLYCDKTADPTDYHLMMAKALMIVLDETVALIGKDIVTNTVQEEHREGTKTAHRKYREKIETQSILERDAEQALEFVLSKLESVAPKELGLAALTPTKKQLRLMRNRALQHALKEGFISETTDGSGPSNKRTFVFVCRPESS